MSAETYLSRVDEQHERSVHVLQRARLGIPGQKSTRRLHLRPAGELMANPSPLAWLIRGWIELDCFGLMFGDPGCGKSFMAIDIACSIATGTVWHDCPVRQGTVFYIAGEGANGIGRRLRAWQLHHGVDVEHAPLHFSTIAASLTDEQAAAEAMVTFEEYAELHGIPSLIVIDTVARNFGPGDENSTKDMTAFVNACDRLREATGACVLLVHHSGHGDKKRARGSTALKGALDWEFGLSIDGKVISMTCTKSKDSEPPSPKAFRLRSIELDTVGEDGERETSAVPLPALYMKPPVQGKAGRGKNQTKALRVLQESMKAAEAFLVSHGRPPEEAWVPLHVWRDRCAADGLDKKRFSEVSKNLAEQGAVLIEGDRVTLQDAGLAVPK